MCHVIKEIVFQVTSYNNLTNILIECFPVSNMLFLDGIPYSILQILKTISKPKLERGGIAPWLKNISNFIGEFYKMNYKTELAGILNFIKESIKSGQVVEVCILRQILTKMSGWNPPDMLTERMLKSLAAGPKLKVMAHKLDDSRNKTKKSSEELCKVLQQPLTPGGLSCAIELAILAGQQAQDLIFKTNTPHLKLLSLLYDSLIGCIVHMIDLLSLQYTDRENFASKLLPHQPIISLRKDYNLPIPLIMCIVRPGIDIIRGFENIISQFKTITENCDIPIEFYAVFWSLSLADIKSSEEQYNEEIKVLQELSEKLTGEKKQKIQSQIQELEIEKSFLPRSHLYFAEEIRKRANITDSTNFSSEMVQKCIFPRLLCGPVDAMYCASFIETVQKLKIPHFPTMSVISNCISFIIPCLNCCSEVEAQNIGLFTLKLFSLLSRWSRVFDKECKNTPGFIGISSQTSFLNEIQNFQNKMAKIVISALKGNSYIVQKNALHILCKTISKFPKTNILATDIIASLEPLKDSDLDDVKLLAGSYFDQLDRKFTVKHYSPKVEPKKALSPSSKGEYHSTPRYKSPKPDRRYRNVSPEKKPRSPTNQKRPDSRPHTKEPSNTTYKILAMSHAPHEKRRESDISGLPKKRERDESDRDIDKSRKESRRGERTHEYSHEARNHSRNNYRHDGHKRENYRN